MKRYSWTTILSCLVVISILAACSKEAALEKSSYGSINIVPTIVPLGGGLDVKMVNGTDTIPVELYTPNGTYAMADKPQKILIYKTGADNQLLGDTTITIAKDEKKELKFVWFEEAGLHQFFTNLMPADSGRIYLKHNLDAAYPAIDIYIFNNADTTLATGVVAIQEDLRYGVSGYPSFTTLPAYNADGSNITYIAKMKDRASGLFIREKGSSPRDYLILSVYGGQLTFMNVTGYKSNGRFTSEYFLL